jgi:hypothetical protein
MANPVWLVDRLAALPGTAPSWQNDASSTDTNNPQDADSAKVTTPTGLSPNLREIKSEVRSMSVNLGWINYSGLDSAPSPDGPTKISDSSFSLPNDWSVLDESLNLPITAGQRVRFTFSDGTARAVGTIITVDNSPVTSTIFTMLGTPITGLLATTGFVEFSAAGSPYSGVGNDPLVLIPDSSTNYPTVPALQGGTGHSVVDADPVGDVVVGTTGFPATKVVQFQENQPIDGTLPNGGVGDQVMWWDNGVPTWRFRSLADQVPDNSTQWLPFIQAALATTETLAAYGSFKIGTLTVNWINDNVIIPAGLSRGDTVFNYATPFSSGVYAIAVIQGLGGADLEYIVACATVDTLAPTSRSLTQVSLRARYLLGNVGPQTPVPVSIIAIGV